MRSILMLVCLTLTSCGGFSHPLMPTKVAWNPVVSARCDWNPCPIYVPYFHGYDETGEPRCTVRPLDMNFYDVDQLNLP